MLSRVVVLPVKDNNGVSLRKEIDQIRLEVLDIAGGYSESYIRGAWRDEDGNRYFDTSVKLEIAVDEGVDVKLVERLPYWTALMRQMALYTYAQEIQPQFILAKVFA
jgi:hypothetical protein